LRDLLPSPRRSKTYSLNAIVVGFLLAFVSAASVIPGVILMWIGLAQALTDDESRRWMEGFVVAILLGTLARAVGGTTPAPEVAQYQIGRPQVEIALSADESIPADR
jgi:hypothetical protein